MKIKELIKALEKCNPNGEVFIESIEYFHPVIGVIDYSGDEESYIIESDDILQNETTLAL